MTLATLRTAGLDAAGMEGPWGRMRQTQEGGSEAGLFVVPETMQTVLKWEQR